jgi:hypothetical protein
MGRPRCLGFVAADPVHASDLRRRMIGFVAGGPVATAITAVLATLMLLGVRGAWPKWAEDEITLIAYLAGSTFLLGLIPYSGKLMTSDAARLRMLWKDGPESLRFCSLMLLINASRSGVRPRELNPELVATLPGPADGSMDWLTAELFYYNVLIDNGRVQDAHSVLMRILDADLHPQVRGIVQLQAVWFEAKFNHDLAAARARMAKVAASQRKDDGYLNTLLRARAGIALLERRLDDAETLAHQSLRHCDKIEELGAVTLIREKTEELLAEIAAARASGSLDSVGRADPIQSLR